MKTIILLCSFALVLAIESVAAQQPTPVQMVVQAAALPGTAAPASAVPAGESTASLEAALAGLAQVKAGNEETLKKQEAMLQQLDDLIKAAGQLKIFSKRGGGTATAP
jgi:Skp family chaperone for outer membrane proteins